jgi:hemerythrin-like metal-binding protein
VVDDAVRALYGYIRVHFREEEELMEGIGDPNIEKHRQAHDRFILAFDDLIADHRGDSDFAKQLALFVAEWLVAHIQGMDLTIRSG